MKERDGKVLWNGDPFNPGMGEGRYQDTLRRFRARIADGLILDLDDSNMSCAKNTSASWGLCSNEDATQWPDPEDHTFPVDYLVRGRVTPRSRLYEQPCPMERPETKFFGGDPARGCYYRCDIFRPRRGAQTPTRAEVVARYDALIASRESLHGRRTTADDGEEGWREADEQRANQGAAP